jgi:pyrroline-5-carboxylate reductase
MGVAILSGVLASLESPLLSVPNSPNLKWESHTPGTRTPAALPEEDPSLPSRFIACVSREESAKKLRSTFPASGSLAAAVEIFTAENLRAVQEADVVLLWYVFSLLRLYFLTRS